MAEHTVHHYSDVDSVNAKSLNEQTLDRLRASLPGGGFVLLCAPSLLWSSLWSNALECDVSRHLPASPFLLRKPKIYSFISSRADLILIGVSASLAAVGMPTWCKLYEQCKGIYWLQWCTGRCAGDSSMIPLKPHTIRSALMLTQPIYFVFYCHYFFSESCRVHELFFKKSVVNPRHL